MKGSNTGRASGGSAQARQRKPRVQGEGDYESAREYNKDLKEFIDSGKVDEAARASAPGSSSEADAMERAERAGKSRAKEEDRLLRKPGR